MGVYKHKNLKISPNWLSLTIESFQVSIVMEQMIRLLHNCGLPKEDVDFINSDGITMNKLLMDVSFVRNIFRNRVVVL